MTFYETIKHRIKKPSYKYGWFLFKIQYWFYSHINLPWILLLLHVSRLWATVLAANITGAFLFAVLVAKTDLFPSSIEQILFEISHKVFAGSFWQTFFSAVFAGWLIALMVWLLPFAETARVTVIVIITYIVGLGGFAHIIAGSVNAFYALVVGNVSITDVGIKFIAPTLLGNTIGGVTFVSIINYAQVRTDKPKSNTG